MQSDAVCLQCRRTNRADARFCDACGAGIGPSLSVIASAQAPRPVRRATSADDRFVGRERELAALEALVERLAQGHGAIVAIAGEPGIGKSRTAQALADLAADRGIQALWGRCNEEPGAPPYWPWAQIFDRWVAASDDAALRAILGSGAAPIAEVVPAIGARLGDLPRPPRSSDPMRARFLLFDAISGVLRRAAAHSPLLLIIDDMHWADAPSLRLLEFLAANTGASPMLLLITYRDIELSRRHPLSETLGELGRHHGFQRLRLTGLSRDETARVMTLGIDTHIAAPLLDAVHEQTEGNPLFVLEMARLLAQEGFLERSDGPRGSQLLAHPLRIPEGVKETIGRRLNRLSPVANEVLGCAAVIGRTFELAVLVRIVDGDAGRDVSAALEEALRAKVVEARPAPGRYRFAHALIRETLYEEIAVPVRSRLHLEVARAIEAVHALDLDGQMPALAHHYGAALPGGDTGRAAECAIRAARRADRLLAHEETARYYRLALLAAESGGTPDPLARSQMHNALGEALTKAGEYLAARDAFEEAARLARECASADQLARAALGFETASWAPGQPGIAAAALLREALAALHGGDSVAKVRLLGALARALIFSGDETQALAVHRQAVGMARRAGDPSALASALLAALSVRWQPALSGERLASIQEALALARAVGDRVRELDARAWSMFERIELGEMQTWRSELETYERDLTELRQPFEQYVAASSRAMHALFEGRFTEAEQLAQQALLVGRGMPGLDAPGIYGMQMFTLRCEQGRLGELAPLVRQFVTTHPSANTWRPGLALIYAELGDLDQARAAFEVLAADDFAAIPRDGVWVASLTFMTIVCAALDDTQRAGILYRLLRPYDGRNLLAGTTIACYGAAASYLGMLAGMQGHWSDAERHFESALALNARQGAAPALAHAHFRYAQMLLRRAGKEDLQRAAELLTQAAGQAEALGMTALARRVTTALSPLERRTARPDHPGGLTEREAQVLRLIAGGKANREIAALLFVSPNTVANHVRSILSKTGSANRTEAAGYAIRNRLLRE